MHLLLVHRTIEFHMRTHPLHRSEITWEHSRGRGWSTPQ
jgi:hypothetical protein